MSPQYYDVNGTKRFPRTLKEAFPHDMDPNPFGCKSASEKNIDNIFSYLAMFFVGFVCGIAYASR